MPDERGQARLTLLLAWIAGYVDTFGYLYLARVFTAHMSGNAAAIGAFVPGHQWGLILQRGLPIPIFVLGIMAGIIAERLALRAQLRSPLLPAFAGEALCLLAFLLLSPVLGSGRHLLLLSLLTAAMGLQTATLKRAEGSPVHTTFVTGMLTNMAQQYANGLYELVAGRPTLGARHAAKAAFFGGIFALFIAGAVCGGFGCLWWHASALWVPLAGLVGVAVIEWWQSAAD